MTKQKTILAIIILILLGGNIFLVSKYLGVQGELAETKMTLETQQRGDRVLNFTKLFIIEVLKSEEDVDFETRLQLENAVRDLGDDEILDQWNKFTESETEIEAQEEVKNLLEMLIGKIEVRQNIQIWLNHFMDCLFCKIIAGEIPAEIVYQDEDILAFKDVKPAAPVHILIVPKKHLASVAEINSKDALLMGKLVMTAKKLAEDFGISESGYKLLIRVGKGGGQEVMHIHLHLMGGVI